MVGERKGGGKDVLRQGEVIKNYVGGGGLSMRCGGGGGGGEVESVWGR